MPEDDRTKTAPSDTKSQKTTSPLVFISHDTRDAELAEAFSTLLRNVSSGMLKSFRSSDKKGNDGIEFGDEWYNRLMERLDSASDVVCLFTERSVERPWILYEAGVAKGKLNKPVLGVALGVPLRAVSTGPFYQFQNCDDSPGSLGKLLKQLAGRVATLELIDDVVSNQVEVFKNRCEKILKALNESPKDQMEQPSDAAAKLFEEMKVMIRDLPSRFDERLSDSIDPRKRRRISRLHPGTCERLIFDHVDGEDPIGILMLSGLVRDELPWLYEISLETYKVLKKGARRDILRLIKALDHVHELAGRGAIIEEMMGSREMAMITHEIPLMLQHALKRSLEIKKSRTSG